MLTAVALGRYAGSSGAGPGGSGMLPRIPAPPADLRTLLFMLGVGSTVWYLAALAAPLLAFGARRSQPERLGWPRTLGASLAILVLLIIGSTTVEYFVVYGTSQGPPLSAYLAVAAPRHILPWVALGGLIALVEGRRRTVRATLEGERLRRALAEQRLLTLTAQLHPHFLFNTLQGISTLIRRDPEAADELLARLSDLLREVLRHRDQAMVTLGDELQLARTYLEITRLRFSDRFSFSVDVPETLLGSVVPLFILQPLIENAVTHGIGKSLAGGHLVVRGRLEPGRLVLEVEDDGAGIPAGGHIPPGLGLANTRDRLRASYGEDFFLELVPLPRGVLARLGLPLQPSKVVGA